MAHNRLVEQGNWLFRWRSYVPILLLIPAAFALREFRYLNGSQLAQHCWAAGCLVVSCLGFLVRAATVGCTPRGTSGCNTHAQKAVSLNTTGMYALTRNPLYFGNFLIWLGIVLVLHNPLFTIGFVLAFWLYYERIIAAEEDFLTRKFGIAYVRWADATPAFVPRVKGWRRPELPFSARAVVRRDYGAILGIAVGYFLLDVAEHIEVEHRVYADWPWTSLLLLGVCLYVVLRFLKKHTALLQVDDRRLGSEAGSQESEVRGQGSGVRGQESGGRGPGRPLAPVTTHDSPLTTHHSPLTTHHPA